MGRQGGGGRPALSVTCGLLHSRGSRYPLRIGRIAATMAHSPSNRRPYSSPYAHPLSGAMLLTKYAAQGILNKGYCERLLVTFLTVALLDLPPLLSGVSCANSLPLSLWGASCSYQSQSRFMWPLALSRFARLPVLPCSSVWTDDVLPLGLYCTRGLWPFGKRFAALCGLCACFVSFDGHMIPWFRLWYNNKCIKYLLRFCNN